MGGRVVLCTFVVCVRVGSARRHSSPVEARTWWQRHPLRIILFTRAGPPRKSEVNRGWIS